MKKFVLVVLLLAGIPAFAQKVAPARVPAVVKGSFSKTYPGIKEIKWEKENDGYEATFKAEGQKTSVSFDKEGKWIETERSIPVISLPADATLYIEKNFHGKIARYASATTLANGATNYEAHISGRDYIFDGSGKFLRVERKD